MAEPENKSTDPSYADIKRRMEESPGYRDICTCMVGVYGLPYYARSKPKECCVACDGCGGRVKRTHVDIHNRECVAYKQLRGTIGAD